MWSIELISVEGNSGKITSCGGSRSSSVGGASGARHARPLLPTTPPSLSTVATSTTTHTNINTLYVRTDTPKCDNTARTEQFTFPHRVLCMCMRMRIKLIRYI